ncbi:MAG: 2,3-bisphosphoglycerate-dependent phosphoglycerate mutase [Candidatus Poseidoniaceae archaeon]|nr:2,3-bisphosphoglycerate-dependent phosphoglycerate mutase [Candidatus Poseidoniaceae archaeon]MDP7001627.1 2,3-bisphosphoglycerate-dependent phosphoglycerate mutase [Candidatus Poseidoniaceae archaeon]
MRHGQSIWNAQNRFTGWADVELSELGVKEAIAAGDEIADLPIDEIHTSALIRAQMTALLSLSRHNSNRSPEFNFAEDSGDDERLENLHKEWEKISEGKTTDEALPVHVSWQLNERMYGDLQGLEHQATRDKFGDEQVHIWRRSYDIPPPNGESLEMTAARTIPYLSDVIIPALSAGKNIFVAAHGNSLRSIIMHLDGMSREQVLSLEVPTGKPIVYSMENGIISRA